MTSVDRILIDPGLADLAEELPEAAAAVNADGPIHAQRLPYEAGDAAALWQEMGATPEGSRRWSVPRPGLFGIEAALLAIWWTDFLGRRHLRLLGGCRHRGMELPTPLPSPHRPPLACVYPDACVVATQHRRSRLLAVCDCGAWGPPERVAWMGPHCGPCFDRGAGDPLATLSVLPAHGGVRSLAFAPDGRHLAAWDQSGRICLWDLDAPQNPVQAGTYRPSGKLAFSPDGRYLAWCSLAHERLHLLDRQTGIEALWSAAAFAFTPTPGRVVLAEHPTVLTEMALGERAATVPLRSYRLPFPIACRDLAVSPDGAILAAVAGDRGLCLWDAHSGEPLERAEGTSCHEPLAWSPDGSVLACGVGARFWKAMLWDADTRQRRGVIGGTSGLNALAFSPDGQWLVSAEEDAVRTWQVSNAQERRSLSLPAGEQVLSLAFSPDGSTVALGLSGGRVRLWPAEMLRPDG